jgi:hypothetical protein
LRKSFRTLLTNFGTSSVPSFFQLARRALYLGFYDAEDYHKRVNESRSRQTGWKEAVIHLQGVCRQAEEKMAAGAE